MATVGYGPAVTYDYEIPSLASTSAPQATEPTEAPSALEDRLLLQGKLILLSKDS